MRLPEVHHLPASAFGGGLLGLTLMLTLGWELILWKSIRHTAGGGPAGLTDAGLPCGLQIVGSRHRDDLVLRASYAYEQARPFPALPREVG